MQVHHARKQKKNTTNEVPLRLKSGFRNVHNWKTKENRKLGVEKVTDKERKRREEAMGNGQFTNFLLCLMPIEARKINVMKIKKNYSSLGKEENAIDHFLATSN